jgi:hypothetical protein
LAAVPNLSLDNWHGDLGRTLAPKVTERGFVTTHCGRSHHLKKRGVFGFFSKVGVDPKSGRPTPPLYWSLTTFFVVWGWLMSALLVFITWLAIRDNEPVSAAVSAIASVLLPTLLHWCKRQIQREQAEFAKLVQTYERAMEQAVP